MTKCDDPNKMWRWINSEEVKHIKWVERFDSGVKIIATNGRQPVPFGTSWMVGREGKRTNNRTMLPALKNNAATGYQDPLKIDLLKGADLQRNVWPD